jgi:hypothetical protein
MKAFSVIVSLFLIFSVIGCAGARTSLINHDELSKVSRKLISTKRAVVRYQQAEEAALREDDEESAAVYRKARESALEELPELQQRYDTLEAERQEYLKRQQDNFMNPDE